MPTHQEHTRKYQTDSVKRSALQLGFDACGIASAEGQIDPEGHFRRWLEAGFHGDMGWLSRTAEMRVSSRKKLPGARSVVVVAKNYYSDRPPVPAGAGLVARYAWGRDYHKVLRKPLIALARALDEIEPGAKSYASIDTGPVLERAWAARAGVGSVGKNSLALRRDLGSWFFLATILTTVELEPDSPAGDICGTCTLCIDACPTQAIVSPRMVDSRRCISYQTIENRDAIPEELHAAQGDWVFGCDICQDVCPWNRFAKETTEEAFRPRDGQANPDLNDLIETDEESFNRRFAGTPIRRAKFSGMQRNARIALSNQGAVSGGDSEPA